MTAIVDLIAGARPNFMKIAPLYHELARHDWAAPRIIHTGQHYDPAMSGDFFRDLGLPAPHRHLGVGGTSHAEQTGRIMVAYEALCVAEPPAWTIVVGDVNSTLACSIAAKKLLLPVAHLEAGLRSGDRTMPEEINRLVTDAICDLLWTPSSDADENLRREGVPAERIELVGNIMIDAYEAARPRIAAAAAAAGFGLAPGGYGVVTLHRPANVDAPEDLAGLMSRLAQAASRVPLVFPVHPRTRARLEALRAWQSLAGTPGIHLCEPLGYVQFMSLVTSSRFVLTDSGGVQEETTYLGIPCITVRANTERPITVTEGTNRLVGPDGILPAIDSVLRNTWPTGRRPALWDGHTAGRVAASLRRTLERSS